MHITFACLLCKISNELETPSFCRRVRVLKNTTTRTRLPGFLARVRSGCYLLCSLLSRCNFNNRSQDRSENHSCSWRPKNKRRRRRKSTPRERGAPPPPQIHLRAGWHRVGGGKGHWIDNRKGLVATGRFDGYDCKKKILKKKSPDRFTVDLKPCQLKPKRQKVTAAESALQAVNGACDLSFHLPCRCEDKFPLIWLK